MNNIEICKAGVYAQDVADCLKVAYRLGNDVVGFNLHAARAHEQFEKLAEVMGYRVELKE